ncbi:MAG: class I SAM-dependent methyltransferase [Oligoflexia bacterium]|nr:class I SAM-dependent methyltransferase [Oligoflexia bacterium]
MASIYSQNIEKRFLKPSEYYVSKRHDFLELVPKNAKTILDVGCGSALGWKDYPAEVSGIELNPVAANEAKKYLKTVVTEDVEKATMPFEPKYFDCIVMADVLEHLYDPWGMILKLKNYLKPDGVLLISIPNVRHYSVIRSLIFKDEFSYQDSGILDVDHVRFFTLKETSRMLTSTGFKVERVINKISGSKGYKILNKALLNSLSNFLTEQYYIVARPV